MISQTERHPLFLDDKGRDTGEVRVALVERMDAPGKLGVAKRGARFVVALPDGYDMRTSVTFYRGHVIVAHPTLPALEVDHTTNTVKLIDTGHVSAQAGRLKLRR